MTGVVLYGPPAAGKDTVTVALHQLDARYRLFRRIKHGPGRTAGYRMVSAEQLEQLRRDGEVIWENHRYGATYVVDRAQLLADAAAAVPVLHLGQLPAVDAVRAAVPAIGWLTVELWCPRAVAAQRIRARGTGDDEARLAAYDQTDRLDEAALRLDTTTLTPEQAAAAVDRATRTTVAGAPARPVPSDHGRRTP